MEKTYSANQVTNAIKSAYQKLYTGAEVRSLVSVVFRDAQRKTSTEIENALKRQIPAKNATFIVHKLVK